MILHISEIFSSSMPVRGPSAAALSQPKLLWISQLCTWATTRLADVFPSSALTKQTVSLRLFLTLWTWKWFVSSLVRLLTLTLTNLVLSIFYTSCSFYVLLLCIQVLLTRIAQILLHLASEKWWSSDILNLRKKLWLCRLKYGCFILIKCTSPFFFLR